LIKARQEWISNHMKKENRPKFVRVNPAPTPSPEVVRRSPPKKARAVVPEDKDVEMETYESTDTMGSSSSSSSSVPPLPRSSPSVPPPRSSTSSSSKAEVTPTPIFPWDPVPVRSSSSSSSSSSSKAEVVYQPEDDLQPGSADFGFNFRAEGEPDHGPLDLAPEGMDLLITEEEQEQPPASHSFKDYKQLCSTLTHQQQAVFGERLKEEIMNKSPIDVFHHLYPHDPRHYLNDDYVRSVEAEMAQKRDAQGTSKTALNNRVKMLETAKAAYEKAQRNLEHAADTCKQAIIRVNAIKRIVDEDAAERARQARAATRRYALQNTIRRLKEETEAKIRAAKRKHEDENH
jgi:hypothetical protein